MAKLSGSFGTLFVIIAPGSVEPPTYARPDPNRFRHPCGLEDTDVSLNNGRCRRSEDGNPVPPGGMLRLAQ